MTKWIDFAYPTSPIAERYGHPNGCYVLKVGYLGCRDVTKCIARTKDEAQAYGDNELPDVPWLKPIFETV